jgi:hypothetical protein
MSYKEDTVEIEVICVFCDIAQPKFTVSPTAWERYSSGAMCVQDAFPLLDSDKRELLVSATCKKCWDEVV